MPSHEASFSLPKPHLTDAETLESEAPDLEAFDEFEERWLSDPTPFIQAQEHTPWNDVPPIDRGILDRMTQWIQQQPMAAKLATLSAMIVAACSVDFSQSTHGEKTESHEQLERIKSERPKDYASINIDIENSDIVIHIDQKYEIRIADPATADELHEPLPLAAQPNDIFDWHANLFEQQFQDSFGAPNDIVAPGMTWSTDRNQEQRDGALFDYSTLYGSLEIEDKAFVENYLSTLWLEAAKILYELPYDSIDDLEQLEAWQWMQVLQAPGSILEYDPRFASMYAEFDANATTEHTHETIDQLIRNGKGVCRDVERINIISYRIADELFDLQDRGLLYIPQVNVADAAHTRGAFLYSASPTEIIAVGVDATYASGDIQSLFDIYPADSAAWYLQEYDQHMSPNPKMLRDVYEYGLALSPNMSPTAKAIMQREIIKNDILLAAQAENVFSERMHINAAFTQLLSQLTEEMAVNTFPLNLPSRTVRLFDLFIHLGTWLDEAERNPGIHTGIATRLFSDYLEKSGVDPAFARTQIQGIDRMKHNEREEYINNIIRFLESW